VISAPFSLDQRGTTRVKTSKVQEVNGVVQCEISAAPPKPNWAQFHPEQWRYGLDGGELADSGRRRGVTKDGHSRHAGGDLFE